MGAVPVASVPVTVPVTVPMVSTVKASPVKVAGAAAEAAAAAS